MVDPFSPKGLELPGSTFHRYSNLLVTSDETVFEGFFATEAFSCLITSLLWFTMNLGEYV